MRRMTRWIAAWLFIACAIAPLTAQNQAAGVPRTADGKPDLRHLAGAQHRGLGHPGSLRQLGVPAGQGVVEGNEIPYQPWALAKKQENYENRRTADPEAKCYLPGVPRITYMPFPFQIVQTPTYIAFLYEYVPRHAAHLHGRHTASRRARSIAGYGRFARPLGRRHAGRRRRFTSPTRPGSTGPATSTATRCTWSSATRRSTAITSHYEATIEDPKVFTRPWKMSMPLYRRQERNVSCWITSATRCCRRKRPRLAR